MMTNLESQRGAVLAVSLFLLLGMLIVGVSVMRTAVLEERMVRNEISETIGTQSAEAALRDGERWLNSLTSLPHEKVCASGPCNTVTGVTGTSGIEVGAVGTLNTVLSADEIRFDHEDDWLAFSLDDWVDHGQLLKVEDADGQPIEMKNVARQPRYVIREERFLPDGLTVGTGVPPGRYQYEITAVGTGRGEETQRVLQSTFIRRY